MVGESEPRLPGGLGRHPRFDGFAAHAPREQPLGAYVDGRIDQHRHPARTQELGKQWQLHRDLVDALGASQNFPPDVGMGHRLQLPELREVVEDDLAEKPTIDSPVNDHLGPPFRDRLERGSTGFEHLVADPIRLDDVVPVVAEQLADSGLSRSDSAHHDDPRHDRRTLTSPVMESSWQARLLNVIVGVSWLALVVGVFVTFFVSGISGDSAAAAFLAGFYVVGLQALRSVTRFDSRTGEFIVLFGSLLTMGAVALTGGPGSGFLLLSATPILLSAALGERRLTVATAALAIGIITTLALGADVPDWGAVLAWGGVYLAVAAIGVQARRLLREADETALALATASAEANVRLERLEHANRLLSQLADSTDSNELNPLAVGEAALTSLRAVIPFRFGSAAFHAEDGPVVVARVGTENPSLVTTHIPMSAHGREVGLVSVSTDRPVSPAQEAAAGEVLRPAGLAFANISLLQQIGRQAAAEERTRLARELHDEIGPGLASLGLALDLMLLERPGDPGLASRIESLRGSVTSLVEDVREAVTDLRDRRGSSLVDQVSDAVADLGSQPAITFDVHTTSEPSADIRGELVAIVTEAIRNAARHSDGSLVEVTGEVSEDHVSLYVVDDGSGFDLEADVPGHYGLVGMQERADNLDATLDVASGEAGTAIHLRWSK